MGESKYRKATDPNYGKPTPKAKGLIISPPLEITGETIHIKSSDLDTQELRASLLYWDRLSVPTSNIIHMHAGDDADYLQSCGILQRRQYTFVGSVAKSLIEAQILDFKTRESEEPGIWSLGGGENSILVEGKAADYGQGSILCLYNTLPVPKEYTSLADILEFKEKRQPELYAIREHIDQLIEEISSSNDSIDMLNQKLKHLDIACSDLIKTTREYQLPFYLSSLNASLNFDYKTVAVGVSTWAGTGHLGLNTTTATIATIATAAASMVALKSDIKFRSLKRPTSPFKYAYHVERDLG